MWLQMFPSVLYNSCCSCVCRCHCLCWYDGWCRHLGQHVRQSRPQTDAVDLPDRQRHVRNDWGFRPNLLALPALPFLLGSRVSIEYNMDFVTSRCWYWVCFYYFFLSKLKLAPVDVNTKKMARRERGKRGGEEQRHGGPITASPPSPIIIYTDPVGSPFKVYGINAY